MPQLKNHTAVPGYKLVWLVPLGLHPPLDKPDDLPGVMHIPTLRVTNPNCAGEIIITKMSIIRSAVTQAPPGTSDVVYEDKFLAVAANWDMVPKTVMNPHESWVCVVHLIPRVGGLNQQIALYTVEIFWEPKKIKDPLSLIGFQTVATRVLYSTGQTYYSDRESQMVNMVSK